MVYEFAGRLARGKVGVRPLQYRWISSIKPRAGRVGVRPCGTLTRHLIRPAKNSAGLMCSGRVRRHTHRRNWSAPACGFSCGPRACGSGSP